MTPLPKIPRSERSQQSVTLLGAGAFVNSDESHNRHDRTARRVAYAKDLVETALGPEHVL